MKTFLSDASQKRSAATRGGSCVALIAFFASGVIAADQSPPDSVHLLYLADNGLAVIRLRIDIDGKSQRELCRACAIAICKSADRDGDGLLTDLEYDQHVANHPVFQEQQIAARPGRNAKPVRPEFTEGKLPVDHVADFLIRRVWPPVTLEFATNAMQRISPAGELLDRPIADAQLFQRLDTDGNYKLTSRELDKAVEVLEQLDFDEDEMLSIDELRMRSATASLPAGMNRATQATDSSLSLLPRGRIDAQSVRRVLTRYDGKVRGSYLDLRLDRHEAGVSEEIFTPADADEDGFWDFDELRRFLEHPQPTVEIAVHLTTGEPTTVDVAAHDTGAVKVFDQHPNSFTLDIHGTQLRLLLPQSGSLDRGLHADIKVQFQALDVDKNEYLEPGEYPFGAEGDDISPSFRQMDADANEKVYFDEYLVYFQGNRHARASQIVIHAENLERTLFGPLDANADGRLSHKELSQLAVRVAAWDRDADGTLLETEIPQQYRLTMSRGEDRMVDARSLAYMMTPSLRAEPDIGPVWFRKMDRNRDGEVSAREFLGLLARFEKIDANADGAIDAEEAAAVK